MRKKFQQPRSFFRSALPAAGTAQEGSPLLTRPGWEAAAQARALPHLEPDFAKLTSGTTRVSCRAKLHQRGGCFPGSLPRVLPAG